MLDDYFKICPDQGAGIEPQPPSLQPVVKAMSYNHPNKKVGPILKELIRRFQMFIQYA